MKSRMSMAIAFSFILSVYWAFASKIAPTVKSAVAQSPEIEQTEIHIIIEADGEVLFQRDGESEFRPAYVGTKLYDGDLLKLGRHAEAIVRCTDLTEWIVPVGVESGMATGCPKNSPPVLVDGIERPPLRGNSVIASNTLHIISPRKGMRLLNDKPKLRWRHQSGVTSYTVQISTFDGVIWEKEVPINEEVVDNIVEFEYPGTPSLQTGTDYYVKVSVDNDNLSLTKVEESQVFNLLNEEIAQKLDLAEIAINKLNIDIKEKALLLGYVYYAYSLNPTDPPLVEAIDQLELLTKSRIMSAPVYRHLGNLYWQVGLLYKAEKYYLKASKLCQTSSDIQCVNELTNKLEEYYLNVSELCQASGDTQCVNELTNKLEELNNLTRNNKTD